MVSDNVFLDGRYWRVFATWAAVLATINGVTVTVQAGFGLEKFGGLEYVPCVSAISVVRELGPGAATAAILFALVTWSHPLSLHDIRSQLPPTILRALLLALLSLPGALGVAVTASFLTGWAVFDISWSPFCTAATKTLVLDDLVAALTSFGANAIVVGAMAWATLPRLAQVKWSLFRKIASAWVALLALRLLFSGLEAAVGAVAA